MLKRGECNLPRYRQRVRGKLITTQGKIDGVFTLLITDTLEANVCKIFTPSSIGAFNHDSSNDLLECQYLVCEDPE